MINQFTPIMHDFGTLTHSNYFRSKTSPSGTPGYVAPEMVSLTKYSL